jgi:hypothetical protein
LLHQLPTVEDELDPGTQALHDAVLAVKDPSNGDKAIVALAAKVVLDEAATRRVNDQLEFWQTTAVQVIKDLRYTPATRALVTALMTHSKLGIVSLVQAAIMRMPIEAEPLLGAALDGSDPELAKLAGDWESKGHIPVLMQVLAYTSLDSARDAIVAYIPRLDNDANRAAAAQNLIWFPTTPPLVAAFKSLYAQLPPIVDQQDNDTGDERSRVLGVASEFFDPTLGSWALGESAGAQGDYMLSARVGAIQSAIKLMRPADKPNVGKAITSLERALAGQRSVLDSVRAAFKLAAEVVDKCASRADCYVKMLDEPIPQTPNSNWKAIKAAYMAGMLGNERTRKDMVARVPTVKNPGVRLAMAVAINHLAPKGDRADANVLDKIVADDRSRNDGEALRGDDALARVALMLRARDKSTP